MKKYEDIIRVHWPRESSRTHMPLKQRAKIFLPFAALTGYDKALNQTLEAEVADMKQKTGAIQYEDLLPENGEEIL